MPDSIHPLSEGDLTPAAHIRIDLVEAGTAHEVLVIHWPDLPTPATPLRYDGIAAEACRILTNAGLELARQRAGQE